MTESSLTEGRKADHIRINLEQNVQFPRLTTGLEKYRFQHNAVPEISLSEVRTETTLFGKELHVPILISSMTGGTEIAGRINKNLARVAQQHGMAMGLGSLRAAIEDELLVDTYQVRDIAPNILLFANLGAVQLNYGYGIEKCRRAVNMVEADALILHFNVLQEAVQPEGDTNFRGLLNKVEQICTQLEVPVIAKEVGWGFSAANVRQLVNAGISAIDVAGSGGTSWSEVEYHRAPTAFHARVAAAFADWGIPTAVALCGAVQAAPHIPIFASGGLRDGIDVAKCLALGASLCGLAGPFLKAADVSVEAVDELVQELMTQLRVAMLCSGARDIEELKEIELLPV